MACKRHLKGFTLAELLICLAILGEIATFTIPKIISAQQNTQKNAITKEAFATVSAAFQSYSLNSQLTSSTSILSLTPYMNYVRVDTTSTIDGSPNDSATYSCASRTCLKLHNGSILAFGTVGSFGGTNTTNMQWFLLDPDGSSQGNASSIWGVLYYNGRVTTWGTMAPNSYDGGGGPYSPGNYDPSWFSW